VVGCKVGFGHGAGVGLLINAQRRAAVVLERFCARSLGYFNDFADQL